MKKIYLFTIALLFVGNGAIQAQVEENDNKKETEITVKDAQGKQVTIDLPEAMTQELDSLMQLYNTKKYLKPDTNCNMPDVNPVYDKTVYMKRLSMLPTVIEMPYNDVVQTFIDRYSGHLRNSVSYMLGAQNFYMPIFEEALDTYGLPLELKYLPVIESALNPCAVSRVGATGLWQFMIKTAKKYGLTVNSLVDERRDPIKSSYDFVFRFSINTAWVYCWKIRFNEISIIMCLFFGSECIGLSFGVISSSRFLLDCLSLCEHVTVSLIFVRNRFTNGCKAIEIFYFIPHAKFFLSCWLHTQVYIYSHLPLL